MAGRESLLRDEWLTQEAAAEAYLDFEAAFGPGHALLARHAAFPLILSPELVNLIWINFTDWEDVPWIAGADFLLSRLCRSVGGGLYRVDPNAREVMLVDLVNQDADGPRRLLRLADFLLAYVAHQSWLTGRPEVLRAYQWIAWSYLDPERVVADMTSVLQATVAERGGAARREAVGDQRQVAAMLELVRAPLEFSLPPEKYHDLVETADSLVTYWYPDPPAGPSPPQPEARLNPLPEKIADGLRRKETIRAEMAHATVVWQGESAPAASEGRGGELREARALLVSTLSAIVAKRREREGANAVDSQPGRAHESREGIVEIGLKTDERHWYCRVRGPGYSAESIGMLQIDDQVIEQVRELSESLASAIGEEARRKTLRLVGRLLKQQIFVNNFEFTRRFYELEGRLGVSENIKIEFIVPETAYPIMLEAVLRDDPEGYWMLDAPVYRRCPSTERTPLFGSDRETRKLLHCLIIEADVQGLANVRGKDLFLRRMTNVSPEADFLFRYLQTNKEEFGIERLELIREARSELSFLETIHAASDGKGWDIVHYAGHSYYDESTGGFFFLPGRFPEVVSAEYFSYELGRPRFIYLSSSSSSWFAKYNLGGALVGFQWEIEDARAFEFSKAFYQALFGVRSLEYAVLQARREMYARLPESLIWAAPVLVM
ncbi:MAG: CHAT domain-containing protein [Verrucomicrobiia bacterium]